MKFWNEMQETTSVNVNSPVMIGDLETGSVKWTKAKNLGIPDSLANSAVPSYSTSQSKLINSGLYVDSNATTLSFKGVSKRKVFEQRYDSTTDRIIYFGGGNKQLILDTADSTEYRGGDSTDKKAIIQASRNLSTGEIEASIFRVGLLQAYNNKTLLLTTKGHVSYRGVDGGNLISAGTENIIYYGREGSNSFEIMRSNPSSEENGGNAMEYRHMVYANGYKNRPLIRSLNNRTVYYGIGSEGAAHRRVLYTDANQTYLTNYDDSDNGSTSGTGIDPNLYVFRAHKNGSNHTLEIREGMGSPSDTVLSSNNKKIALGNTEGSLPGSSDQAITLLGDVEIKTFLSNVSIYNPRRNLSIADPVQNYHAATKLYVDQKTTISNLVAGEQANTIIVKTTGGLTKAMTKSEFKTWLNS